MKAMKVALIVEHVNKKVTFAIGDENGRVTQSGQLPLADLPFFLSKLKGKKDVRIALIAEKMVNRKFLMPPAKEKLIKELIRRQLVQLIKTEVIFRCGEIGTALVEGVTKKVFQVIGTEFGLVEEIYALLERNGARPSVITTYPVPLSHFLRSRYGQDKVIAFVELNESYYITVVKGPEIRIFRHLGKKNLEEIEQGTDTEMLVKALLQTLFYHKQEFRGENIDILVLSGKGAEKLREALRQELQLEVLIHQDNEDIPLKGLLGLMEIDRKTCEYNLLPPKAIEKEKVKKTFLTGSAFILLLIAMITFRHARLTAHYQNLSYFKKELEKSVTKKEMALKKLSKEFIAFQVEKAQPPWPEVLFEMSALVPGRIVFTSLSIERKGEIFQGEAEGKIVCENEIEGIELLDEMKRRFDLSPYFENISCEEDIDEEGMGFKLQFRVPVKGKLSYGF